jgi:hypothetical protein
MGTEAHGSAIDLRCARMVRLRRAAPSLTMNGVHPGSRCRCYGAITNAQAESSTTFTFERASSSEA